MKRADIILPGLYSEYGVLQCFIESFAASERYSVGFVEELQLTVKEAFVNAIRHGNMEQTDMAVSCGLSAADNILLVSVRDCGKGFNLDELPNPVDTENRFKLSGRGLYIIKSIAEIIGLESDQDGSVLRLRYIPY